MRTWKALGAALLLATALSLPGGAAEDERSIVELSGPCPDFQISLLEGNKSLSFAELRGRILLLSFWAPWCPACRSHLPTLVSIQREYWRRGVAVVGVLEDELKGSIMLKRNDEAPKKVARTGMPVEREGKTIKDREALAAWDAGYCRSFGLNFNNGLADGDYPRNLFDANLTIPTTILIDERGMLVRRYVGATYINTYRQNLNELLARAAARKLQGL